jgi:hypothetical protein
LFGDKQLDFKQLDFFNRTVQISSRFSKGTAGHPEIERKDIFIH